MPDVTIRELHTIDEYRDVVALEQAVWGYTDFADVVTVPVFVITVKRGAILLGAFDPDGRLVGFSYAIVGLKDGRPIQWSHMTGVLPGWQGRGVGQALKLAQRERALALGYDLIEWTFDPLQAMNAHFNFARLGTVVQEYARNVYGESSSALHKGTPTDRFVAEWHIREPHVERRIRSGGALTVQAAEVPAAPQAIRVAVTGGWRQCRALDLAIDARRLWVEIPGGFTRMQREAPAVALEWRMQTREAFEAYLSRGYRVVDFALAPEGDWGRYLLALRDAAADPDA
ncbi:MAG: hypothetical protein AB7H88_22060 [Vicinamibacterales bacterium]